MRLSHLFIVVMTACFTAASGQKSRVLSVFQMIEAGKYEEAREAIELAAWHDRTSGWPRTYLAKGMLCQEAWEKGLKENDSKKMSVYPDQLFVAYAAYEKALRLDKRGRLHPLITAQYYKLANDFQVLGERQFRRKNFTKAMEAFEHALLVSKSDLVTVEVDTSLVYNTAVAAFEARSWEKAVRYLDGLDQDGYSANAALLLHESLMHTGDSLEALTVLERGVTKYGAEEDIVLRLVDRLVSGGRQEKALAVLDTATSIRPEEALFPWTRGLLFQRGGDYEKAIADFRKAYELAPGETRILYALGIAYYNMGVEINEKARHIADNMTYREARENAREKFRQSVRWLEKAYELDSGNPEVITKLYQLYQQLQMTEKMRRMERLID